MNKCRIGIDVGATNIKVGLFDSEMNMIDHIQTLIDQDADINRLMDYIAALAKRIAAKNNIEVKDLLGVGAAFPCYMDYANGIALDACNIMALSNAPVRDMLSERLGVPVLVDNDANAAALGEHRMGAGMGHEHMIYAALATGIGGGLILNGKLYRGMHGMAGEIGHMFVSDSIGSPCLCGVTGCVQSISSGANMAKYVTDRIKEGEDSTILNYAGTLSNIDMEAVGKALKGNDPLALEVVDRGAEYLGRMFHSLNQLFDINVFVYGGGISKLGSRFIDRMIAAYRHYSLIDQRFPAKFIPAKFGDQSGLYGAALLLEEMN
ncbi:MAG: ROK family protein [Clostridia bacterium]|nr:ROK family protein [Clostridia bacterium]